MKARKDPEIALATLSLHCPSHWSEAHAEQIVKWLLEKADELDGEETRILLSKRYRAKFIVPLAKKAAYSLAITAMASLKSKTAKKAVVKTKSKAKKSK